jgi:CheY-like chemotaxis protein
LHLWLDVKELLNLGRRAPRRDEIVVTSGGITAEEAERVLAFVSHELRGPISAILGWTSLLLKNQLPEAQQHRALQFIERIAKVQQRLADDLMDSASVAMGRLSVSLAAIDDIASVVEDAVDACAPTAAQKRVAIAVSPAVQPIPVLGDAHRLHQALCNLIDNAVKFTPADGRVVVSWATGAHEVEIRVEDTGPGIAPRHAAHIFEPFWQGPQATAGPPGLGLGLAITRSIVELHAGTVDVVSRGDGQGTAFIVRLPGAAPARPALHAVAAQPEPMEEIPGSLTGRLLLVEDDPSIARAMQLLLETWGYDVRSVATGADAAGALASGEFDIALCDLHLADGSGLQLMETLRRRGQRACPVIAMSGLGRMAKERALGSGFAAFLEKPVAESALLAAIQACTATDRMPLGI